MNVAVGSQWFCPLAVDRRDRVDLRRPVASWTAGGVPPEFDGVQTPVPVVAEPQHDRGHPSY